MISSASPVISASLAEHSPETTTASAYTWLPAENSTMSSRTSSAVGMDSRAPERTTLPLGAVMMVSLSRAFLLRSSWTMPMPILANMMPRNMAFCQEPTESTQAARKKNRKLK